MLYLYVTSKVELRVYTQVIKNGFVLKYLAGHLKVIQVEGVWDEAGELPPPAVPPNQDDSQKSHP